MLTYLKFRWQRILRRWSRKVSVNLGDFVHEARISVFGKGAQLSMIRRFVGIWVLLIGVCVVGVVWQIRHLAVQSAVLKPLPGGTYTEGLVGSIKTINPILPDNSSSADAVRVIFNGLTRFDTNGQLQPGLATDWQVSADGKTYTFHLRKGVKWHDGVPFTSQDVLFTIAAIQNPDTRSPLAPNWQGVRADAPNDNTVVITLPKPYTPFINSTSVGIIPRHLLENTEPSMMRVATFNQHPVGTGPFKVDSFDSEAGELKMSANPDYYAGKPYLSELAFQTYATADAAYQAYTRRQVMGVSRLRSNQVDEASHTGTLKVYQSGVPDQVGVFFHTTSGIGADKSVRLALAQATDRHQIIDHNLGNLANALAGPITATGLNLSGAPHQPGYDLAAARNTLQSAGWLPNRDGIRVKDGKLLEIKLVTQSDTAYSDIAKTLSEQWKKAGVKVDVSTVDASTLQQSYLRTRKYDAILYGINTGADPDVYTYWHSSQAIDPGLNLASYSSATADKALEAGRTLQDPETRAAKYKAFITAWVNDDPAIMLYSPTYLYGVDKDVHGINIRRLITPADRFDDVQKWSVRVKPVPPTKH
jgi:peptide/nickel transport system substrate-binding protein